MPHPGIRPLQAHSSQTQKCTWVYSREVPETIGRIIPPDKKFGYDEHSTVSSSKWSTNISVQSGTIVEFVVTIYETL